MPEIQHEQIVEHKNFKTALPGLPMSAAFLLKRRVTGNIEVRGFSGKSREKWDRLLTPKGAF